MATLNEIAPPKREGLQQEGGIREDKREIKGGGFEKGRRTRSDRDTRGESRGERGVFVSVQKGNFRGLAF